jgi:sulfate/thiosulfate transport system substrate-binding protein
MRSIKYLIIKILAATILLTGMAACGEDSTTVTLLNVSYDPTRELYQEFNREFIEYWKEETGQTINIRMSHGGSGSQSRAVIDGLEADVVTLALAHDITAIQQNAGLIEENWQSRLPDNSAPYTSTLAFLVRKGNPLNIQDWDDLIREDVSVITPNPKTSGVARWNYLAMWGYALQRELGDLSKIDNPEYEEEVAEAQAKAREFVAAIYRNVPVLDSAARGATNTFVQRGIGDVLINWENEILLAGTTLDVDGLEMVIPQSSILAEPTVSVVDRNVETKGTREIAQAYLEFLYTETGQELAAKHFYRPRSEEIANRYQDQFPTIQLFTIDEVAGGWHNANEVHFRDGGIFDQFYQN